VKAARAIVIVLAIGGPGCAGAPLGGSTGTGGAAPPCTTYTGCGTGAGGTGGIDTALCADLESAYAAALTAAYACTPGAPGQCQALVDTIPMECPVECGPNATYVNDNTQLEAVRGQWLRACDPNGLHSCIEIACTPTLVPSVCVPTTPGATTGTCVPYGSDAGAGIAPDGGESCDELVADYTAAVSAAKACTPGAPNQCEVLLNQLPSACNSGCTATVAANDATAVNAAWSKWASQCALDFGCPLSICDPPPGPVGTCAVLDGPGMVTGGICVTETPLPP